MAVSRLPYAQFQSFSRLFATYAGEFDSVSSFFAGDYRDPRQRGQIALQVADNFGFRSELIDVLMDQNRTFGAGKETIRNIERLADPNAVAVVTGQQLGLFTGPLYTLYKTITAIQLARRMESDTGRPVIPVFWLEGEDHDMQEVAYTAVYAGGELHKLHYHGVGTSESDPAVSVGRVLLDESVLEAVSALENALPPTEFRERIVSLIREHYKPGASFLHAFSGLLGDLFAREGLVCISGDDARLKRLAAPLFRKEIREFSKSSALLKRASSKLEDAFHVQVRAEPTNLFLITENGRISLTVDGERFRLKGTDTFYSVDELLSMVDETPEMFSPNVVLRPIFQDAVLPTAAYVAGPGEIAYFAQFKSIYEWAGVPMPIVYPRASVTLLEPKIGKILDRFDTAIPAFENQVEQLFHSLVVNAMEVDAEGIFERAGQHLHDAVNTVSPAIEAVDQSLGKSAESTRAILIKEWTKLKERVVKAEKRRQEQTLDQLVRARAGLFPGGGLQERSISALYFMNKYGTDLIDRLLNEIELDTSSHQVISL